jgi:hypothetical protein
VLVVELVGSVAVEPAVALVAGPAPEELEEALEPPQPASSTAAASNGSRQLVGERVIPPILFFGFAVCAPLEGGGFPGFFGRELFARRFFAGRFPAA